MLSEAYGFNVVCAASRVDKEFGLALPRAAFEASTRSVVVIVRLDGCSLYLDLSGRLNWASPDIQH